MSKPVIVFSFVKRPISNNVGQTAIVHAAYFGESHLASLLLERITCANRSDRKANYVHLIEGMHNYGRNSSLSLSLSLSLSKLKDPTWIVGF